MPLRRKSNKQHAANHADPHRQRREDLLRLLRRRRKEATHHILIKQSNRSKHQNGHERVHEIDESQAIPRRDCRRKRGRSIDDPQAAEGREAVADVSLAVSEAIGEAEEEAGRATERD